MYNTLNPVNSYNNQGFVRKNQDDEEQQQQNSSRSRRQVQRELPARLRNNEDKSGNGGQRKTGIVQTVVDDAGSSRNNQVKSVQNRSLQVVSSQTTPINRGNTIAPQVNVVPKQNVATQNPVAQNVTAQNTAQNANQTNAIKNTTNTQNVTPQKPNANINIAQILKDFRKTTAAIGAPDSLVEEVEGYLSLIETTTKKDQPNVQIVKANLKTASTLLDEYISKTLEKQSKVVNNWIEALFLQKVDYKFDDGIVNTQLLVQFPDNETETETEEIIEETVQEEPVIKQETKTKTSGSYFVPSDEQLKKLFLNAKRLNYANKTKDAMEVFKKALKRAIDVGDLNTQSLIRYEMAQIFDKNDYLSQALTNYNKSTQTTDDNNLKTKAYYSMGQIYDDVSQFEVAMDHYMTSISYAGEADNLPAQSTALTKIGNMFTDKYDETAFNYYGEASLLSKETDNYKVRGYVSSNIGDAQAQFLNPKEAMASYADAIGEYSKLDSPIKLAVTYKKAAELMEDKNPEKAKNLYKKALSFARKTDKVSLMAQLNEKVKTV